MRYQIAVLYLLLTVSLLGCTTSNEPEAFEKKATWAVEAFPAPVMTQKELQSTLDSQGNDGVLLIDTRTEEEYRVSHLAGAINWPDYKNETPPAAVQEHASEGKPVVFYCSIGYRSGEAAVIAENAIDGEAEFYNLRGGIFQWANEGRDLEGGNQVHGYDDEWGKLLKDGLRADTDNAD